jgi:hypothetical protein
MAKVHQADPFGNPICGTKAQNLICTRKLETVNCGRCKQIHRAHVTRWLR